MLSDNKDYVRIILNKVKCKKCNDVIISHYNHHFVGCSCGAIATDGGNSYIRRVGDIDSMEDMSVYSDAPFEVIRLNLYRGSFGKKGGEPLHWVALRDMSNDHVLSVIEYCEKHNKKEYYEYYLKEKKYRGI